MSSVLYLDSSAVLRAVLERGTTPAVEQQIGEAKYLLTSRLAPVEAARALLRLRLEGAAESVIADAERELDAVWARCTIWELTREVTELASQVAPRLPLRTLDALHLATYLLARRTFGDELSLLSADRRLLEAAGAG